MADSLLPKSDPQAFDNLMRAQAHALHAGDRPPATRKEWEERRARLRDTLFAAVGSFPDKPCPLEPKEMGVLKRQGYRIEKVVLQTRPDVWATTSVYVPEPNEGKVPAVLVVHGHWAGARRDTVVQDRCLGLVKLGFLVLAIDAFGAGERYTKPAKGTYHGALYGSTLWPVGQTLLGMQVYDNRRAVDYLLTRPELDGEKLGITGASGGGNQTMYAGALDERFKAVVPVCSVGTYQSYLHAACCVCEVLPGGLRLAEEGDILALVAPRALMVINATEDGFQFSVGEARKSLARAKPIFKLYDAEDRLRHAVFESKHAYNQEMRETMYGWMTQHLKGAGDGKPIPEPKHDVETMEDLSCYGEAERPKTFLFPPSFAAREARALLGKINELKPDHPEDWESSAVYMRSQLRKLLGEFPKPRRPEARFGKTEIVEGIGVRPLVLEPEPGLTLHAVLQAKPREKGKVPACVLLHLDGKAEALKQPVVKALLEKGWGVLAPDLRATGESQPANNAIAGAPDHNSAEHALWVGRPLLGQWVYDVQFLLDWLGAQSDLDRDRFAVVGVGQAGVVALCAAALLDDRVTRAALLEAPVTYVTEEAYAPGTRMGLLAPGILRVGDVPHLAAVCAPRRLLVSGGITPQGKKVTAKQLQEAYAFTVGVYKLHKKADRLTVAEEVAADDLAAAL
jgi:dienelactone hydrolase